MCTALAVNRHEYGRMLQDASHVIVSLDNSVYAGAADDGDVPSLADLITDLSGKSVEETVQEEEMVEELSSAISALPERDQIVLNLYYQDELTLKEIGQVLGVSESRVSQIHTAAVVKLRALLRHSEALIAA
jgi:RNA polymerase sigma factor for flagellar operon FliA